ncbi:MAG: gliding motility-associated C-terminal domain-containing protein [Lewinellaceae bacterium]|nr:gliding motility-associated C-terminal domain-containing protein [Lewinellaceae bacterium]
MWCRTLKSRLWFFFLLSPFLIQAQASADCLGAIVLCSDTTVHITGNSIGEGDFVNPNNDPGCLETIETRGRWFYFEFEDNMPPNSTLEFVLTALEAFPPDYDFALYGPDVPCDSLGEPVRCSFAWFVAGPATGLASGYSDLSESFDSDGFLAPLQVQPGEGYYLFINDFWGESAGFDFDFGGSAADYLNCNANPNCSIMTANAGPDSTVCSGDVPYQLIGSTTHGTGFETYTWRGANGEESFLNDPNIAQPTITFPDNFSDTIVYILEVQNGDCVHSDTLQLVVLPTPVLAVAGPDSICSGAMATLDVGAGFDSYLWSTGDTLSSISVSSGGLYTVLVTGAGNACSIIDTLEVVELANPQLQLSGDTAYCAGQSAHLSSGQLYPAMLWSTGDTIQDIVASTPGNYSLTVTDANGCSASDTVFITELPLPQVSIQGNATICDGGATVLVAGQQYPSMQWSTGSSSASTLADTAGTYILTVTDANGCMASDTHEVAVAPVPEPQIQGDSLAILCDGSSLVLLINQAFAAYHWSTGDTVGGTLVTGPGLYSITVTDENGCTAADTVQVTEVPLPSPGLPDNVNICVDSSVVLAPTGAFESYSWSNTQVTPTITTSQPGWYYLSVTDSNGCVGVDSALVQQLLPPDPMLQADYSACPGASVAINAATGMSAYLWSTSETSASITIDSPGPYSLTVTDGNGCQAVAGFNLLNFAEPDVMITGQQAVCAGDTVMLDAGSGYTSYQWQDDSFGQQLAAGSDGVYSVTVTDANGCLSSDTFQLEALQPPVINIPAELSFCAGEMATIDAGQGYAGYVWTDASTGQSLQVGTPGTYGVTVTDDNGCENSQLIEVSEWPIPVPDIDGNLYFCPGTSTTLLLDTAGLAAYAWSTGGGMPEESFDSGGNFTISVTDTNGCAGEFQFVILELAPTMVSISGDTLFCEGNSGQLDAGLGYASYLWSTGDVGNSIMVDSSGLYTVEVANALGCLGQDTIVVAVQPPPSVSLPDTALLCEDGLLILDAGSGLAGYQWSTGDDTQSVEITDAGTYTLQAVDSLGCEAQASVEVVEIPVPSPDIEGDFSLCPGQESTLSVTGDYVAYAWSNGDTDSETLVVAAGFYTLTVTDAAGCQGTANILVNNAPGTSVTISGAQDFCEGNAITLDAGNHTSYLWSDSSTGSQLQASESGEYSVTVTNISGCTASDTVSVQAFPLPTPGLPETASFCEGSTVLLQAELGYDNYQWVGGTAGPSLSVSAPGWYYLEATDTNGCVGQDSTLVSLLMAPVPEIAGSLGLCPGDTASLAGTGGYASYLWSGGETLSSIEVWEPGIYSLTVTDASGCQGTADVEVSGLSQPVLLVSGGTAFCEGRSLVLDAGVHDTYKWSDGSSGQQLEVYTAGSYSVTVTNAAGCMAADTAAVVLFPAIEAGISGDSLFCDGSFTTLQATGGPGSYEWSTGATEPSIEVDQSGPYSLVVTDVNGCRDTAQLHVQAVSLPVAEAGQGLAIDCLVDIVVLGDEAAPADGFFYQWNGPGIDASNEHLQAPSVNMPGLYTLIVTDTAHNCISVPAQAIVDDLRYSPPVVAQVTDSLDCATSVAIINGQGSAEGPAYVYQWYEGTGNPIPGANGLAFGAVSPGVYTLAVLDTITGCQSQAQAVVTADHTIPAVDAGPGGVLNCIVEQLQLTGMADLQDGWGVEWNTPSGNILGGAMSLSALVDEPGWYFLSVTDPGNGCQATDSVFVEQDIVSPVADAGAAQQLDCTADEVQLDGAGSSQGANFRYEWVSENGITASGTLEPTVNQPGTYVLTVTNLYNGCSSSDSVQVDPINNYLVGLDTEILPPVCYGQSNGAIVISGVQGGTPPFLYSFNGAPFSALQSFPNLGAGQYELRVEDALGCSYELEVFLPEGNTVLLDLGEHQEIDLGEEAWLNAITNLAPEEIGHFSWSPGDVLPCDTCLANRAELFESTVFKATIVDTNGCSATDVLSVIVRKDRQVYIPNAFSPNGDGSNDEFVIFAGDDVVQIKHLIIHDRWGGLVFELKDFPPNDPYYGWNGAREGHLYNPAVFVYMAEIEFVDGEVVLYKGDVNLIR